MICLRGAGVTACLLLILLTSASSTCVADELPSAPDSVSTWIAEFEQLPPAQQQTRRERAAELRTAVLRSRHGPRRLDWLRQAVEADPTDASLWLALSDQQLLMGYENEGARSLAAARLALESLPGTRREAAATELALAMAWWHYRRAEWAAGAEWGRVAVRRGAGLAGQLAWQINRAQPVVHRDELTEALKPFQPLNGGSNRAADVAWVLALHEHFHLGWLPPSRAAMWMRGDTDFYDHDVQRWRDFGVRSESHSYDLSAGDYYEKSLSVLPCPKGGWLHHHEYSIPALDKPKGLLPFWTNSDEGYVTGSQMAYLGWLRDRMLAARDPLEADRLARMVTLYYERISRRSPLYAWPELWQAEAQLELDQDTEARVQLRTAQDTFDTFDQADPALGRARGRLLSRKRNWGGALPLLRRAVRDFPDDPATWSDLAVAEAGLGHDDRADRAFARALALDLDRAGTWRARGRVARQRGDLQSAQADFERALQLAPTDTTLQNELMAAAHSAAEGIRY